MSTWVRTRSRSCFDYRTPYVDARERHRYNEENFAEKWFLLGVSHGDDILYYFGIDDVQFTDEAQKISDVLVNLLVDFAETG